MFNHAERLAPRCTNEAPGRKWRSVPQQIVAGAVATSKTCSESPVREASAMSAPPDEDRRLRDTHDFYVWKVNAAIGEGREDLVWKLADDYFDTAMQAIADAHPTACERPDCAACTRPRTTRPRRGWLWRVLR